MKKGGGITKTTTKKRHANYKRAYTIENNALDRLIHIGMTSLSCRHQVKFSSVLTSILTKKDT